MAADGQGAGELRPMPPGDIAFAVMGIVTSCNERRLRPALCRGPRADRDRTSRGNVPVRRAGPPVAPPRPSQEGAPRWLRWTPSIAAWQAPSSAWWTTSRARWTGSPWHIRWPESIRAGGRVPLDGHGRHPTACLAAAAHRTAGSGWSRRAARGSAAHGTAAARLAGASAGGDARAECDAPSRTRRRSPCRPASSRPFKRLSSACRW